MLKTLRCLRTGVPLFRQNQPSGLAVNWRFVRTAVEENSERTDDEKATNTKKEYVNPFSRESPVQPKENTTIEGLSGEEREKRLKVLQLEADIAYQEGRRVPKLEFFNAEHWNHVLTLPSKSARLKYYGYLWQIDMKKQSKERKKVERAAATEQRLEDLRRERDENNHIIYGLGHTSLFLRVYDSTINHWQNHRLIRAMQFSPKIVIDCSYDNYMTKREAMYAAKQLMFSFAENRSHDDPFDLHYCNVNMESVCMQGLQRFIPTMLNPEFPMNIHRECFTEVFPKKDLVYLTPHCRTDLETYNPDDIYIVGAMVDTVNNEPLSLAKAKKLGLRMARLPLDNYLQWGAGSGKSLTINQMINIMLDLKSTGDWTKALKHVPRRKVVDMELEEVRQKKSLSKRAGKLNIRLEKILNLRDEEEYETTSTTTNRIRSHKEDLQFDIDTWGKKKKNKNSKY